MLPAAGPQCGFLKRKIFQGVDLMIREPKALHVEVRLAAIHDIGDGAACRACLRPARRTVSNIEEQVGSSGIAEDWRSPGTYRPKAGPVTRPAIVAGIRKQLLRYRHDASKVRLRVGCVIARELGLTANPQRIPEIGKGDEVILFDNADLRRTRMPVYGYGNGVSLHRPDRQIDPDRAQENRRIGPKRHE